MRDRTFLLTDIVFGTNRLYVLREKKIAAPVEKYKMPIDKYLPYKENFTNGVFTEIMFNLNLKQSNNLM
jgi:hypothetical protein